MSDKCTKCGSADFTEGGKCRPCQKVRNEAYRAKHANAAGGGSAVKRKKKTKEAKPAAEAAAASTSATLEIEHGYGLKASIDEAYLIIEQHDGETDSDDKICVSRSEFRLLVEKFSGWAACSS